jgi:catechol 2,3-dioxygenase-like lactoylglutathione lyase family enzyme
VFVSDIKASCDFFTQKLGFSIVFVYGEPPFWRRSSATADSSICAVVRP